MLDICQAEYQIFRKVLQILFPGSLFCFVTRYVTRSLPSKSNLRRYLLRKVTL